MQAWYWQHSAPQQGIGCLVMSFDQTILHAAVEREQCCYPFVPWTLPRTVSVRMLCVQLGLTLWAACNWCNFTCEVHWTHWSSGQHTFICYQEEIASPSCIMQVSHGVRAFNCCLFVHIAERLSPIPYSAWQLFYSSNLGLQKECVEGQSQMQHLLIVLLTN